MSSIVSKIAAIESAQLRELPPYRVGDTVRVHFRIREGEKERVQVFEGVVIRRRKAGLRSTLTVRKVSYGVRRGAHLPRALAAHREDRDRRPRPRPPGAPLLPPRPARQEGPPPREPASGQRAGRQRVRRAQEVALRLSVWVDVPSSPTSRSRPGSARDRTRAAGPRSRRVRRAAARAASSPPTGSPSAVPTNTTLRLCCRGSRAGSL